MKAINKFFYALLAFATVGMVACSEDNTYEPGAPEVEGCYDVYFPDANTLETQGPTGDVSLDPTEATEFTYTLYRNNSDGEIVVPVNVTKNTDNKFVVSEIKFLDGEDVAEFQVSLLESEIGVTYSFALSIDDPQYVKQYDSRNANSISLNVTRVKWVSLGECSYTDDIVTSWYGFTFSGEWAGVTHPTYNVEVQVRADSIDEAAFNAALEGTGSDAGLAGIYRLVNPYRVGPWGDPEDPSLTATPNYIVIHAEAIDQVYIPFQPLGMDHIIADMSVMSEAYYQMTYASAPENVPGMWGVISGGTLRFEANMLCGSPGGNYAGKIYGTNADGAFALVIAPALGKYELALPEGTEDGDFEFSEVDLPEGALFYSESQALAAEPVLEKGKPAVNTDNADRDFVSEYGYLYRLPNLYAEGYPIYFGAKLDGTVTVHPDYADQLTGLKQNGYDVWMTIDAGASKFDPETGLLNLVAEFGTVQGDYYISYGVYNEAISVEAPDFNFYPAADLKSDFTYSEVFTDTFKSGFQSAEWKATLEVGSGSGKGYFADKTAYRIPNCYANGYDLYFVASDEDGKVVVPAGYEIQATGVSIYGQAAYVKILSGQLSKNGVTLKVGICDAAGEYIMPYACTETLTTYTWVDVATGTYVSALYQNPITGLTFQQAEDTNIYRVVDWLDESNKHLMFTWDPDTNKCDVMGMLDSGVDSSAFGGVGNLFVCDPMGFYTWVGKDYSWEVLENNGFKRGTYDPETMTFTFDIYYTCPGLGVGMALGHFIETFTLDGAISEAKWVQVGTGSYKAPIFVDQNDNPYVAPGIVLENKENSNSYRLLDWLESDVEGINMPFKVDSATNMIDIQGIVDTGLPAEIFGNYQTNAYVCDVLTLYTQMLGKSVTWDDLAAEYGGSMQSAYDPETKTYSFIVSYIFPKDGVIVDNSFYKETYTLDQSASTSSVAVRKISSEPIALKANIDSSMIRKSGAKNLGTARLFETPKKLEAQKSTSMKTATPVKRSRIEMLAK